MVKIYVGIIFHINYLKATNHPEKKEQTRKMNRVGSSQPCLLHHWDRWWLMLNEVVPFRENKMTTHLHLAFGIEQSLDFPVYISNFLGLNFHQLPT